ncbi:MAG: family 16 glycoside hydrolase, partial [Parafannyhessea sp.]|uniref:family 16 glycoside hydrolase n=1 Tax=Parafannyhessea sp. TaxID=2847324 RepID=UPI003F0F7E97
MLLSPRLALADDAQTVGSTASASAQVVASQVETSDEGLSVSSAKDAEAEQGQKTVASTTAVTSNDSVQSTDNDSSDEGTPTTASESSAAAQNEESTIAADAAQPAETAASTSAAAAETAADAADSQADSQKQIPSATGSDIKELPGIGSVESAPDSASYDGDTGTLTVDARGKGDQFLYGSDRVEGNVEISTTAHFHQRSGAAGLMFRLQDTGNKICVNMNGQDGTARLWADGAGSSLSYGTYVANIPLSSDDTYKLDVKVVGNRIIYYVNGVRVADANIKLPERFQAGKLGVLTWESFVDYTDLAVSVPEDTGDVVDPNLPETPVGGLGLPSATNRGDRVSVSSDGKSVQMDGTDAGDVYLITTPSHG